MVYSYLNYLSFGSEAVKVRPSAKVLFAVFAFSKKNSQVFVRIPTGVVNELFNLIIVYFIISFWFDIGS
jgi:uncharacterized membrane protein